MREGNVIPSFANEKRRLTLSSHIQLRERYPESLRLAINMARVSSEKLTDMSAEVCILLSPSKEVGEYGLLGILVVSEYAMYMP